MKKYRLGIFLLILGLVACKNDDSNGNSNKEYDAIGSLRLIGEQLIPDTQIFNGEVVGGLSSIDYVNGTYYIVSDVSSAPIRYYKAALDFDLNSFSNVAIVDQIELLDSTGGSFIDRIVDPEALRFDRNSNTIYWTSEGFINDTEDPFVREANLDGTFKREFDLPEIFKANADDTSEGPRHNGVFESLCLSTDGLGMWVGLELPLKQDGPEPVFAMDTDSPVRFSFVNKSTGSFGRQFAYELDKIDREIIGSGFNFVVNGVVEAVQYTDDKFLIMERSFTTGATDGGNTVKIYDVDISEATDISAVPALEGASYTKAAKTLLFNFESIRAQLSTVSGGSEMIVDNIEGMTFGPLLSNGNRSLIVVADNNFSTFGPQLNQFIVFEILP